MLYKIRQLQKQYGSRTVLDIGSLDIEAGKIYTLIGPNGAGKTTLLHLLAFVDRPSAGSLYYQETMVRYGGRSLHFYRQRAVLVEQYPILFSCPVWKNVEYGLKWRGLKKDARKKKVAEVLAMVGMLEFAQADADKLSGGETKRVALARALALDPEVLLCDEPTANVDEENQEIILDILESCNSRDNLSLVFATHSLAQANRLADHSIVLQNGRLVERREKNVFPATLVRSSAGRSTWRIGNSLHVDTPPVDRQPGTAGQIFFHPDSITLSTTAEAGGRSASLLKGVVQKIENGGDRVDIMVDCGIMVEASMSLTEYAAAPIAVNTAVLLTVPWRDNMVMLEDDLY